MSNYYWDISCKNLLNLESFIELIHIHGGEFLSSIDESSIIFNPLGVHCNTAIKIKFAIAVKIKIEYYTSDGLSEKSIVESNTVDLGQYWLVSSININLPYNYAYLNDSKPIVGNMFDSSVKLNDKDSFEIVKDWEYIPDLTYIDMYNVPWYGVNMYKIKGIGNTLEQVEDYNSDEGMHFDSDVTYGGFVSKNARNFNFYNKTWQCLWSNTQTPETEKCKISYDPSTRTGQLMFGQNTTAIEGQLVLYYTIPKTPVLTSSFNVKEWDKSNNIGGMDNYRDEINSHNGFGWAGWSGQSNSRYSAGFLTGDISLKFDIEYETHMVEVVKKVENIEITGDNISSFVQSYCAEVQSYEKNIFSQIWTLSQATQNTSSNNTLDQVYEKTRKVTHDGQNFNGIVRIADNPLPGKNESSSPWSSTINIEMNYDLPYVVKPTYWGAKNTQWGVNIAKSEDNEYTTYYLQLAMDFTGFKGVFPKDELIHLLHMSADTVVETNTAEGSIFYTTYSNSNSGTYSSAYNNVKMGANMTVSSQELSMCWLVEWKDITTKYSAIN